MTASSRRPPSPRPAPPPDPAALHEWVERVAAFCRDEWGLPPITGRIFGWLMVCDPPAQSGAQLAQAIGASRASITTNMRVLTAGRLVRRRTRPRDRTAYYSIAEDTWQMVVRRRLETMTAFREITREGVELLGGGERARRVRAADDVFRLFTDLIASMPSIGPARGGR